jgi:hypothetical protein
MGVRWKRLSGKRERPLNVNRIQSHSATSIMQRKPGRACSPFSWMNVRADDANSAVVFATAVGPMVLAGQMYLQADGVCWMLFL